jgi:sulfide dehydrogenase [flavocytochrome c] flavoprotein subunit
MHNANMKHEGAQRREFLKALAAAGVLTLPGCASLGGSASKGKVVVVGGGFGGATAAKYIRMWSEGAIEVTLVEPNAEFVSCPLSNLVLGGSETIGKLTSSPATLASRHGVRIVRDTAVAVDPEKRSVRLASGADLPYDRLVLSPGVDFLYNLVAGLESADAQQRVLHAWKAGPQTVALRRQLEAMPDGGTFALSIPLAPYRCPPGPYERACQVAWYFKRAKPKSKVLVFDANPDVVSKAGLFKKAWAEEYKGMVDYRPAHALTGVDAATRTLKFEVQGDEKADVLNVIPPNRAGEIARVAGVITANNRWCEVDFLTFESIKVKGVHVLGDAIQIAPAMPKSASMANNHAKVAAAAIVALLSGREVNPAPVVLNTCYSFITDKDVVHVASVHQYSKEKKTFEPVAGAGGLSPAMNALEGEYAWSWARNIWADALA